MQTASQMMAAKKQNKLAKQAAKQNKSKTKSDRNQQASLEFTQYQNRHAMRKGTPLSQEKQLDYSIYLYMHLDELCKSKDSTALCEAEKTIRHMRCIAAIFADETLNNYTNAAQAALETVHDSEPYDSSSFEQMQELLRPLKLLYQQAEAYIKIIPAKTWLHVEHYECATQVILYGASFYERPLWHIEALSRLIQENKKLNDLAKEYQVKPAELREIILDASWPLYRIVEAIMWEGYRLRVNKPESITDLRVKTWKTFTKFQLLDFHIREICKRSLEPFTKATGIDLLTKAGIIKMLKRIEALETQDQESRQTTIATTLH